MTGEGSGSGGDGESLTDGVKFMQTCASQDPVAKESFCQDSCHVMLLRDVRKRCCQKEVLPSKLGC